MSRGRGESLSGVPSKGQAVHDCIVIGKGGDQTPFRHGTRSPSGFKSPGKRSSISWPGASCPVRKAVTTMIEGINAGADDYIAKSADFDVLKARLRAPLRRKSFDDDNRRIREKLVRRETEATARKQGEADQKKLDQRLRDQQDRKSTRLNS